MTKFEQIEQIVKRGCQCPCNTCVLNDICGRDPKEVAQGILNLISYDSDFSKCKVGDWVWATGVEWIQIASIIDTNCYPICLTNNESYTFDGKYNSDDYAPSVFIQPPLCFNPGPKPEPLCPFKKGDRVLVRNHQTEDTVNRYFAGYKLGSASPYLCFAGGDEWNSKGKTLGWRCCEAAEENIE